MERILDENEKIRRAEEIYYRRNNKSIPMVSRKGSSVRVSIKNKIFFNLLVLFNISIIVFSIQNKDFIFTKEFLETISMYNSRISLLITDFFEGIWKDENEMDEEITIVEDESNVDDSQNQTEEKVQEQTNEDIVLSDSSSINEMELDILNLKAAYSFIKPVDGIISSGFGARESEYQNVTGYHTGLDIAKEKGTPIKASMEGIVDLVSSEGDYGKHIKIRCNNVTTLYAHCSKIYVKEGQIVAQGQVIGEVGSTGNSTGNHLHFEIRVEDRFVDPNEIVTY